MICCTLLYVHSSFVIILKGRRELVAFLSLYFLVSRDCCMALPRGTMGGLQFVSVVFPDYTHYFYKK